MSFAHPHLLWLIALPLAWFAWDIFRRRLNRTGNHPKILRAEAGASSLRLSNLNAELSPSSSRSARPWLVFGLVFAIVALARPQWGRLEEPVFDQSREILIAMDLSRSMLAPDVKPSRLERAKLLTQALLEKLSGERVGLVVFSGTAFLQSPLSADYEILREFLPALNPDFLPEGGTNYSALIDTALGAFGSTTAADRFLIVLSDGEATDDDWRGRVEDLKKKGIRVLSLGVGTADGAMIPDGAGGLVKDQRGAVVLSKLESNTLHELASVTGGVYQDASTWIDLAALIDRTVETGKKGDFLEKNTVRLVERFQWPLAFALWCLLVSYYYEFPVRPKPRDIKLTVAHPRGPANPPVLPTAAVAIFLSAAVLLPRPARAAEDTGPQLGKIYSRLATQDSLSNQDYAEVARETLRWGQRLKENQQPVLPGPVHDAIQAVDQLIAKHNTLADWTKLRADLEDLLKKPDDPQQDKKDQQQQDQKDQQQKQDQKNQDQSKQDQQQQDQQQKQDQSPKDQNQQQQQKQQDQSQSGDSKDQRKDPPKEQNSDQHHSAFGDMKDRPPQPPPPQETQKVGGVPDQKEAAPPPGDPQLALPLQKLDQLRNQDSPAELFQLMDGDRKKGTPKSPGKNW